MPAITWDEMQRALATGWGELGFRTAETWRDYNQQYFGGRLQPLPVFFTNTTPHGSRLGHCRWKKDASGERCRHIALNMPNKAYDLIADRGTLLHMMVHQALHEKELDATHAGEPWRDLIVRLHKQITGERLWAGGQRVVKERQSDGSRKSKRVQMSCPDPTAIALNQKQIAQWPLGFLTLGPL